MSLMWMFSADVPHDAGVPAYIRQRGDTRLPLNVSEAADAAYIAEKGLKLGPTILRSWPVGTCTRCGGVISNAPFVIKDESGAWKPGRFCSRACRDAKAAAVVAKRGRPRLTQEQQEESKASRRRYQKNLMRTRRGSVLANNSSRPH